ncbi:MAG TPA: VWA domain-containing protein [Terriglobia bacterium]|nr:VWA domain-containing protein [Terriglobia bacterium]
MVRRDPRAILVILAALLIAPVAARAAPRQSDVSAVRPDGNPVKLWVLAEGRGRHLVLDLKPADFEVLDDGRPQRLTYFAARSTEPLSLGVLIETSRSELYEPEPLDWRAYSRLLHKLLRPGDQAFVATFAEKIVLQTRFTEDFRRLDQALREAFNTKPEGTTTLYDSLYDLCEEPFTGARGRKVLLVVADSADESSYHDQVQTLEKLQRTGLTVYFVLPWVDRTYSPSYGARQAAQLFANSTGGLFFLAFGRKALLNDLNGIAAALTYTYTLGYEPSAGAHDGRFHSVKVKCTRRGVKIDASEGYYSH